MEILIGIVVAVILIYGAVYALGGLFVIGVYIWGKLTGTWDSDEEDY